MSARQAHRPWCRTRRWIAFTLALAAALLANNHAGAATGTWPDSALTATLALGPPAQLGGRASATTPALEMGPFALRLFGSTAASGNGGAGRAPVLPPAAVRNGALVRSRVPRAAWSGARRLRIGSTPVLDACGRAAAGVLVMARARQGASRFRGPRC
jgi:hypothetical protein